MREGTQLGGCLFLPGLSGGESAEKSTHRPSGLSRIHPAEHLGGCSAYAGAVQEMGSSTSPGPTGFRPGCWWCGLGRTRRFPHALSCAGRLLQLRPGREAELWRAAKLRGWETESGRCIQLLSLRAWPRLWMIPNAFKKLKKEKAQEKNKLRRVFFFVRFASVLVWG